MSYICADADDNWSILAC